MRLLLLTCLFLASGSAAISQSIGIGTTSPNNSAVLELKDSTKGFLPPRMTQSQRLAINNPAEGLIIYQTDGTKGLWCYSNNQWVIFYNNQASDGDTAFWKKNNAGINYNLGNVGIGISSPKARLHVSDSAVVFSGPASGTGGVVSDPPVSGEGIRFMWYPQKAALRAGYVNGPNWNKDSIGLYSIGLGYDTKAKGQNAVCIGAVNTASGLNSTALGVYTNATGNYSTSMGIYTDANGISSTSMGNSTEASGENSTSIGDRTTASGYGSISMGTLTIASGVYSTSMGGTTIASGAYSTSMGIFTRASAYGSAVMGYQSISKSNHSVVIGRFNDTSQTNSLFEIGNGTANNQRKNAFTVLYDGNVGIGTNNPDAPLSFPSSIGEKIVLYPFSATQRHGIGLSSGSGYSVMRFYVPSSADYVSWGTGSNSSFTENMSLSGDGILRVRSSVVAPYAFAPSDSRYKKGLRIIEAPLDKINKIHGYTYQYRTEDFPEENFSDREQVGLLAQEVESVLPQAVNTNKEGYKMVDYSKLVPLTI